MQSAFAPRILTHKVSSIPTRMKRIFLWCSLYQIHCIHVLWWAIISIKGGFFSGSAIRFSNLQKKNYSNSLSWAWTLNKLFTVMGGNFKFQFQWFGVIYFGDLQISKTNLTLWKKPPLVQCSRFKFRLALNFDLKKLKLLWN